MATSLARVALITGGAQGIGFATANKLASRGISIVLADMNAEKGQQAAKDLRQKWNVPTNFVKVDVTQEQEVKDSIGEALKMTGRLDYTANCAGICESIWDRDEGISVELFDKSVSICYSSQRRQTVLIVLEHMLLTRRAFGFVRSIKHCR